MTAEQYDSIVRRRDNGEQLRDIAAAVGCSYDLVYNVCKGRVKRPGTPRRDSGATRHGSAQFLVTAARSQYLMQGRLRGNLSACIDAAYDQGIRAGMPIPRATLARLVYTAARNEHWADLWKSRKHVQAHQAILPKLHYDTYGLVPFMAYWVIDGRKSDQWVSDGDKIFMPQGFYIMELKTGCYLRVAHQRSAFTARQVALLMLETALEYGPPSHGILCDNGMEQIGKDNVQLFELFWPDEIIQSYRMGYGIPDFHDIYPGAISPVVTSLPRIPTEFAKARLERSFHFVQSRFDAMIGGTAYQGGGRGDVVHTTLKRSPSPDASWMDLDEYSSRMNWWLTAAPDDRSMGIVPYSAIERPVMLASYERETGNRPTVGNALQHCLATHQPVEIPGDNYWRIAYHALDRHDAKRVTALGEVSFTHRGVQYRYNSPALTIDYLHERVDVVPDPRDDTQAGIWHNGRYIGTGTDFSRRVNTRRITIAGGKEALHELRSYMQRDILSRTKGQAIVPTLGNVSHAPLTPAAGVRIEGAHTDPLLDYTSTNNEPDDISIEPEDLSEETRDMLTRISRLS